MKKITFFLVSILWVFSANAQQGSIAYLDENPQFGNIVLGDSITKYLTVCNLLEEKGNGGFKCEVSEPGNERYKVGELSPFVIFVDVENYLIKNIIVYFKITQAVDILRYITTTYGKSNLMDDSAVSYWYGKKANITVGVQGGKASYIIFSSAIKE